MVTLDEVTLVLSIVGAGGSVVFMPETDDPVPVPPALTALI